MIPFLSIIPICLTYLGFALLTTDKENNKNNKIVLILFLISIILTIVLIHFN